MYIWPERSLPLYRSVVPAIIPSSVKCLAIESITVKGFNRCSKTSTATIARKLTIGKFLTLKNLSPYLLRRSATNLVDISHPHTSTPLSLSRANVGVFPVPYRSIRVNLRSLRNSSEIQYSRYPPPPMPVPALNPSPLFIIRINNRETPACRKLHAGQRYHNLSWAI